MNGLGSTKKRSVIRSSNIVNADQGINGCTDYALMMAQQSTLITLNPGASETKYYANSKFIDGYLEQNNSS